jgi:HPt (histidine-containing phosphotransfer) domain-containing protein
MAMTLHLGIDWMPSPLLAPEAPIDLAHLQRMSLGDVALEREVLTMFLAQAATLSAGAPDPDDAAAQAHTLKGSALGIGAFAVAEAADWLETVLREGGDPARPQAALQFALDAAREAIARRLRLS